ncbi:hypothetical protein J1N35_029569 [Gossypium stocksii]|uniref:Pentatricopeptide repeat-containing protein n=1 Tax=Gossypium stocksii TaxID=47602 RepID=A0A9D3ZTD1_9ROSI|nr:hypothetical protein J1N35_029569 [Gossypium stocksii]
MTTIGCLLNKHVKDGCFNTIKTFSFITNTESFLLIFDPLIQTLYCLDQGLIRKHTFDLLITRLCKVKRIEESLHIVQTMMGNNRLNPTTFHLIINMLMKKRMKEARLVADLMRVVGRDNI